LVAGGFIVLFLLATIRAAFRDRPRHGWHPSLGPRPYDEIAYLPPTDNKAHASR
jgi:hypothetical protein